MPPLEAPPKLPDVGAVPTELEWDWRLDALGIIVEQAPVRPGEEYWKLVRADYQGPDEAGDEHHVFYHVLDPRGQPIAGQRVWQVWPSDKTDAFTSEQGEASIPLWTSFSPDQGESGSYSAWVDGLPSDRVHGMGLPLKRRVNFVLTWQRVIKRF